MSFKDDDVQVQRFVPLRGSDDEVIGILWDSYNLKHLGDDHPERDIKPSDIEEVLNDSERRDYEDSKRGNRVTIARIKDGRWILIAWKKWADQRYPFHAREVGQKFLRRVGIDYKH
ncbi:MAG: hypothetical protein ACREN8_03030 [Candidatus Dormibacteraceae bacterium]